MTDRSLILIADSIHSIGAGFLLSFPSILNPAILSPNATDIIATPQEASWINASFGFAGMLGFCVVPPIMQGLGRKFVHIMLNAVVALGFIIFFFANSVPALFVARSVQGLSAAGVTLTAMIIAEYSDPERRGYFMILKNMTVSLGSLVCHSLYFCWDWRQVAALSIVPYLISIILTFLWPESPSYYAMKGRYKECTQSFTYLFGDSPKSKKNLEHLISTQKERRQQMQMKKIDAFSRCIKTFGRRDFLKPIIVAFLLTIAVDACGRYYLLAYIIEMVIEITGDSSVAVYCSMASDLITIFASTLSIYIIRTYKRRTILFTSGFLTAFFMFLLSTVVYLKTAHGIGENLNWLTPTIIIFITFISSAGAIPLSFTILGEIFPLEHKGLGSFATGIIFTFLYATSMKSLPMMMASIGVGGTFGVFGTIMLVCLVLLLFTLNETKDKTLQEIEDEIKGIIRAKPELLIESKPLAAES
ncbi:unnamed protein product [Leptidea sinapis]|uniref:Major facilitator superfamily (MFS) profile domain-containing protein n=1 Tax=Leptidea sinapis TaxID=189913 RepID=A0A5E4PWX8_9NEOP|nr:unnamed protein product [Leptidea sinapis]